MAKPTPGIPSMERVRSAAVAGKDAFAKLCGQGDLVRKVALEKKKQPAEWDRLVGDLLQSDLVRGVAQDFVLSVNKYGAPKAPPRQVAPGGGADQFTDMYNAYRFVDQHGSALRFVPQWGRWLVWDDRRWCRDELGRAEELAKKASLVIAAEANALGTRSASTQAKRIQGAAGINAMMKLAKTDERVTVAADGLDADRWLLNVLNGTLDLRTGSLRDHEERDLITRLAPVQYDEKAECPRWLVFLDQVFAGDATLIGYVQRVAGYALSGRTSEQVWFFLYGRGANGKSVFLEILRSLLGDYALQADFSTFLEKKGDGVPNDIARLAGARFVSATEAEEGRRLAGARVKQLTGGDKIAARFLYREHFEFTPAFKLFLAANHKPEIRGSDAGSWRRVQLIPFDVTIAEDERDPRLIEKLRGELPGILAWAVSGCLKWQVEGLGVPAAVEDATEGYRAEMDELAAFIAERCAVGPTERARAGALYSEYLAWCWANNEQPMSQKAFGTRLGERPGLSRKKSGGFNHWCGIGLLSVTADVRV